ncbi:MAG: efflux RND transporter periplasmic adaptor subunit [Phycisphaerae bacterium]
MHSSTSGVRKVLLSTVLIVLMIGGAGLVANVLYGMREDVPRRDTPPSTPTVATRVLGRETVAEQFTGYGTAYAMRETRVSAEVAGRILAIADGLRAGARVAAGQVLIRIDDREYRQILARAEALAAATQARVDELKNESEKLGALIETARRETEVARAEWQRVADLRQRNLAAKKEYDFADLALQQAVRVLQGYELQASKIGPQSQGLLATKRAQMADVARAKLDIERCEVKAPYAGVILRRPIEHGDWVSPGQLLLVLMDPSHVEISLQLPASAYSRVAEGSPCRLFSDSVPDVTWAGVVARVGPKVDEQTRTFPVYINVDNTKQAQPCVPGTFLHAEVQGPTHRDAILVPRGAMRNGAVYLAVEGKAAKHAVSVVRRIGDRIMVAEDDLAGQALILSHLSLLTDGAAVRLSSRRAAAPTLPISIDAHPSGASP